MLFKNTLFSIFKNKKKFLLVKCVFLVFCSVKQTTVLKNNCQTNSNKLKKLFSQLLRVGLLKCKATNMILICTLLHGLFKS